MPVLPRRSAAVTALCLLMVAAPARAQEYADEQAELPLESSVVITLGLSGDGFVGDSVVFVTIEGPDGLELDLGTLDVDDQGRFFGDITVPDDLEPGTYTIRATGVTVQGATRVLSATFAVGGEIVLETSESTAPTTSTPLTTTTVAPTTTSPPLDAAATNDLLELILGDVWTWFVRGDA